MKSRAGYWLGGTLVAAAVLGAVVWFVVSFLAIDDRSTTSSECRCRARKP